MKETSPEGILREKALKLGATKSNLKETSKMGKRMASENGYGTTGLFSMVHTRMDSFKGWSGSLQKMEFHLIKSIEMVKKLERQQNKNTLLA